MTYIEDLLDALSRIPMDMSEAITPRSYDIPTKTNSLLPEIPIKRVIYSGLATTVYFTDGTKTTVTCSPKDHYDRQTAIVYALVKKIFGKVGRTDKHGVYHPNEIDGNGIGIKLERIAASGFDQDLEKAKADERKATAKAEHEARQKAEAEAAWNRKVQARAEEIRLERAAEALLDGKTPYACCCHKKPLNETTMNAADFFGTSDKKTSSKPTTKTPDWKSYRKPDKPFSEFTQAEKREYWRMQNAKRRANKKN